VPRSSDNEFDLNEEGYAVMPSKYEPLRLYLISLDSDSWTPSFTDIEAILGFGLPKSAHTYRAWWANSGPGTGHSYSRSWIDAGWAVAIVDITREKITFQKNRNAESVEAPKIRKVILSEMGDVPKTHEWDITNELTAEFRLRWTHFGAILRQKERLVIPDGLPVAPGLYRIRIRRRDNTEARYVGETQNLFHRFQFYKSPGKSQKTNIRINNILLTALEQNEAVALSIVTEKAYIVHGADYTVADLSKKSVRRLFENFAQVIEGDASIEDLNL
jgi:hypothetical protein